MKEMKLAALAVVAFAWISPAGAQTPTQACKQYPRMAQGQDVAIRRAPDGSMWYASQSANRRWPPARTEYTEAAWSDSWY